MNDKQDFFKRYADLLNASNDPAWSRFIQQLDRVHTAPKLPVDLQNWSPSAQLSNADFMLSEASIHQASEQPWPPKRAGLHLWLVFISQLQMICRKGVIAPVLLLLSIGLILFPVILLHRNVHDAVLTLALVTTLSAAMGIAFTSDVRRDAGLEITLSTPTSLRLIMLCRYFFVIGVHVLFCGSASTIIALLYHQEPFSILQLWFVPLFFVSALTLALVPLIGAWLSLLAASLLEIVQTLHLNPAGEIQLLAQPLLWQLHPLLLISLAVLCVAFGVLYFPQHTLDIQNANEV